MSINWDEIFAIMNQQNALEQLYAQGGIENQLSLEQQIAEKAIAEQFANIRNNPGYGTGYYKYNNRDLQQWMQGISSPALETAKLKKDEAELLGIPLEDYDPENPYLLPYFADNEYDSKRIVDSLNKDLPSKYKVAANPANDTGLEKLVQFFVDPMLGVMPRNISYEMSKERAVDNMMKDGLTGDQIKQVLQSNEVRQGWNKNNPTGLNALYNIGDGDQIMKSYVDEDSQKIANQINSGASNMWNRFMKTDVGQQFAGDMGVAKDTLQRTTIDPMKKYLASLYK